MTPRNLLYLILGLALFYAYCQMNEHDELQSISMTAGDCARADVQCYGG